MHLRENIVLIGFMGSGKSSVGRLLARRLRFQFVDTDQVIVERARMEIPEIFARDGEETFRDLETSALQSLTNLRRCVIATGGGIVIKDGNRALLRELGFVVCLTASEETIFERVARNPKRPLLQTADPQTTVRQMLAVRRPLYEAAAQLTVDSSALSHEEAADAVAAAARQAFSWTPAA
jgi:shikimate kinase